MRERSRNLGWAAAAWLLAAGTAQAVGGTIFDNNGNVYVTYDQTHWSDGLPGLDFNLPTPPDGQRRSVLRYSGWWVRSDGATHESRLGNPASETYGADGQAEFAWACAAGTVCADLEQGRVVDRRADLGSGVFVSELRVTNTLGVASSFDVFHLVDPLIAAALPTESAEFIRPNLIRFTTSTLGSLFYRASGLPVSRCAADDFASPEHLLAQLNDAAVTNFGQGLSTVTSTLGVHCALQWHLDLAPGETRLLRVSFALGTVQRLFKGDLDLDTQPDIYFEDVATAATRIWPMKGSARVGVPLDLPATPGFRVVGQDDFSFDYSSDLLLRRATPPYELQVRKGDGVGFRPPGATSLPARGTEWEVAATGDFNRDGYADILWRNTVSQLLEIELLAAGYVHLGLATPSPDHALDGNWQVVVASDSDGDGDLDLLWYNTSSGRIVFWWLNPSYQRVTGAFAEPPAAGDANWSVVASSDFGRGPFVTLPTVSGVPDILWRNATSSRLVVWHMNASGQRTAGLFTTPDSEASNWKVVGPR